MVDDSPGHDDGHDTKTQIVEKPKSDNDNTHNGSVDIIPHAEAVIAPAVTDTTSAADDESSLSKLQKELRRLSDPGRNRVELMNEVFNRIYGPDDQPSNIEAQTLARQDVVERILRRSPEDMNANFQRAINAINSFYVDRSRSQATGLRKLIPGINSESRMLKELDRKAEEFEKAFEEPIFGAIVHGGSDLGDEVLLKSPESLATERGDPLDKAAHSSSGQDFLLGNTDYVFANSQMFPSRSSGGVNYRIDTEDGVAVPIDVADFHPADEHLDQIISNRKEAKSSMDWEFTGDYAALVLGLYADNLYALADFKKLYARYNAALFETPLEAVNFYKKFSLYFWQGHPFSDISEGSRWGFGSNASDREHEAAKAMAQMYVTDRVHPPFIPEFMYKTSVKGTKTDAKYQDYPLEKL